MVPHITSGSHGLNIPPIWGTHEEGGDQCGSLAAQPGSHFHDEHAPLQSRSIQCDQQAGMGNSVGLKCKMN